MEYVYITDLNEDDAMEVPTENDCTILLSTLQAQYPQAVGLKYKVDSNRFRAVKLADGLLHPPVDGWQDRVYFCTFPAGTNISAPVKRTATAADNSAQNTDLVVLGIPWSFTDNELKEYFEQFGPLETANVKIDKNTGRSKGFGFIRFVSHESALKAMIKKHKIGNRICDVRVPESIKNSADPLVASKVFVGSLTEDITESDLKEFFEQYGEITNVLIPKPFREFSFITFQSENVAKSLIGKSFTIKETKVNVMEATAKKNRNYDRNNFDRRNDNYNNRSVGFDNRQQGGYQNKRRRNDYDAWQSNAGSSSGGGAVQNVLQAVVSKAVSEMLGGGKNIDPWKRY